jgi:CRP-like cAMP-binding protein
LQADHALIWLDTHHSYIEFSTLTKYVHSLYRAFLTLMGSDIGPVSYNENAFVTFFMFVGVMMYAFMFAVVNVLVEAVQVDKGLKVKQDATNVLMKNLGVPDAIRARIHEYQKIKWLRHRARSSTDLFAELSPSMRSFVADKMHSDALRRVPLFESVSVPMINEMAVALKLVSYMRGDLIVKEKEEALEMFLVSCGTVQVFNVQTRLLIQLEAGDYFGELCLLFESTNAASAIAVSFCDLYVIDRPTFAAIGARHPNELFKLDEKAQTMRSSFNDATRQRQSLTIVHSMVESMRSTVLLAKCSLDVLKAFADALERVEVAEGNILFERDTVADKCFFVVKGSVDLEFADGTHQVVDAPAFVGDGSVVLGTPYKATARVVHAATGPKSTASRVSGRCIFFTAKLCTAWARPFPSWRTIACKGLPSLMRACTFVLACVIVIVCVFARADVMGRPETGSDERTGREGGCLSAKGGAHLGGMKKWGSSLHFP